MFGDDVVGERQTEAGTFAHRFSREKRFEYPTQMFRRNTPANFADVADVAGNEDVAGFVGFVGNGLGTVVGLATRASTIVSLCSSRNGCR